ncbi:MAG: molybdopterin biosynthesis protein [Solirubrobacteraceae bacterium]
MSGPFVRDLPAAEALAAWKAACARAGCPERVEAEEVEVADAAGRVTAAPVWAARSSPAYDAAGMDGIAVRAADTAGASETAPVRLLPDGYAIVDTGDELPPGFDAVVMREHVHRDGEAVELRAAATPYQHVRTIGEDISATELLLAEGERLGPVQIAAAAAAGVHRLSVRRRPVVAILPTGDEVRPAGTETRPGEVPDTNSLMLAAQAREAGCEALTLPIAPDDPERIAAAVRDAAARSDLVIVVAGSSRGREDHTAAVVAATGTLAVHGVAVRPGHPVVLGVATLRKGSDPFKRVTPVLGAPGYPVSAALTFEIFAVPLLAQLTGAAPPGRHRVRAQLARKLASTMGMDEWVRVRLGRVGGRLVATPLARGAGVLTSLVRADGLLVVPAASEGHHAGEEVEVRLLRDLDAVERTIVALGSHDLVLDLAASALRAADPAASLASSNVGSLGGLVALRDGLCHVAGCHLLDPETGTYTLPWIERVLGDREIAVTRLVHREQGLIVAPGNPLGLNGIDDLTRPELRYVNRQRGAGTRVLLDHELTRRSIAASDIPGYAREEHTHLAVAAAVAAGRADCGLGVLAAARAFGLGFVPVTREPYDLVMAAETASDPLLAPLWRLLENPAFRAEVERLGGYDTQETGRRIA